MVNSLIIDARHQLSLSQKMVSNGLTLALWSLWLYMCLPVLALLIHLSGAHHAHRQLASASSLWPHLPHALGSFALIQLCAATVLALWASATQRNSGLGNKRSQLAMSAHDYAQHFGLDGQHLLAARNTQVCVIHHDNHGKVTHIEQRYAA